VEEIASMLEAAGIKAMAYHAGLDGPSCASSQDRFCARTAW
jgi:superfamily II DNA helicase RecQ